MTLVDFHAIDGALFAAELECRKACAPKSSFGERFEGAILALNLVATVVVAGAWLVTIVAGV